jgi:type II secretory pathway pseudopilin PulG
MEARSLDGKDIPTLSRNRALPQNIWSRLACERGFNLVELLVVIPMMAIVLLGIYALYNVGAHAQRQNDIRVTTLLREQNGLERMTREMRQAITFTPVSSQILDAETYVRPSGSGASVERHVRYECLDGSCVRYEGPANSAFTTGPETVIPNVQNPDVFSFSPDSVNPTFVSVKLEVQVQGAANPIILDGGFALRNQAGN